MSSTIKKSNLGTLLLSTLSIAVLSACGGSSSSSSDVDTSPVITPVTTPVIETIQGELTQILPSNALPSNALPSNALPSKVLPSGESDSGVADVQQFDVTLMANQEPLINVFDSDVNKDAAATGVLFFNSATNTISGSVSVENLSIVNDPTAADAPNNAISAIHLHRMGFAGTNGAVLVNFGPGNSPDITDGNTFNFDHQLVALDANGDGDTTDDEDISVAELTTNLLNGGFYFNVHTNNNPAGQLRGQITPDDIQVVRVELQTEQTIPQVEASADNVGGVGYFTFNDQDANVAPVVNLAVEGFEPTAAHVHVGGFAGTAGPVQIALDVVDSVDGVTQYTSPSDAAIFSLPGTLRGAYYLNVHSEENPSGEIRGQILPRNAQAVRVELQTEQTIPQVEASADNVGGVGYFTFNDQDADVAPVVNLTVEGFEPTAAHVHVGGFAGTAGPVQIALDIVDYNDGVTQYTSPSDAAIFSLPGTLRGAYYLNVHSDENPSGEIRGQIVARDTVVLRSDLSSDTGDATGVSYLTADFKTSTINANVQTFSFSQLPDSANLFPTGNDSIALTSNSDQPEGFFGADLITIPVSISQEEITASFSVEVTQGE